MDATAHSIMLTEFTKEENSEPSMIRTDRKQHQRCVYKLTETACSWCLPIICIRQYTVLYSKFGGIPFKRVCILRYQPRTAVSSRQASVCGRRNLASRYLYWIHSDQYEDKILINGMCTI